MQRAESEGTVVIYSGSLISVVVRVPDSTLTIRLPSTVLALRCISSYRRYVERSSIFAPNQRCCRVAAPALAFGVLRQKESKDFASACSPNIVPL